MPRPSPRLLLLGCGLLPAAALPAIAGEAYWGIWAILLAALVCTTLAELASLPQANAFRASCTAPTALQVRSSGLLQVRLECPAGLRHCLLQPDLSGPLGPLEARAVTVRDRLAIARFPLAAARRGNSKLLAIWLRWQGPLGLLQREHRLPLQHEITVLPMLAHSKEDGPVIATALPGQDGLQLEHCLGDGTEFDSLREFVPGFDLRSIDWRASARHRELLCRQFRVERNRPVILAIDHGSRMCELLDGTTRLDYAIHLALQLAAVSLRAGDRVGMLGFAERTSVLLPPTGRMRALDQLRTAMAGLPYSNEESNYSLAMTQLLAQQRQRSLIVLFTEFGDSTTAELMVHNLGALARRHVVLLVPLRDASLEQAVASSPHHPVDLQRAILADDFLRERDAVLFRIRRLGAHVVDASTRDAVPALIKHYLELKRREIL